MIQGDTYEFVYYLNNRNAVCIAIELYRAAIRYFSSISKIEKFTIYNDFFESSKEEYVWDLWKKPEVKEIFQENLMDQIKLGILDFLKMVKFRTWICLLKI
ncbi:MAG: hypothetical protein K8R35_00725 [Bacteroidales bacterium]|nr:hypothetical protein [Bacteroidales bacterium]